MKIILVILLIFSVMSIALSISSQIKDKYDFYRNLKQFLDLYKLNVAFRQDKLKDFIEKTKPKKQFATFLYCYKRYLVSGILDLEELKILSCEEKEELKKIILQIGTHDANNEIKLIEGFVDSLENQIIKTGEEKNKICPLLVKLSLLFAISLVIILL